MDCRECGEGIKGIYTGISKNMENVKFCEDCLNELSYRENGITYIKDSDQIVWEILV